VKLAFTTPATLLGAAALCLASPSAAEPCPSSVACIEQVGCDSTTEASGGVSRNFDGGVSAEAGYDWLRRTCGAASQLPYFSVPIRATVTARDEFFVAGVSPGTPLTIHARIQVHAYVTWPGVYTPVNRASGWLEEAGAGRVEAVAIADELDREVLLDETRALDFPNLAGTPFRLAMGAESVSSEGHGYAHVALTFVGLPPGAVVYSCHVGPPVPARASTWGRLKLRYR
jgi:hypothetical protein